ncbi:curli assembly protein CsgG [Pseudaminobacter sp. 19-2017]|uniref:Curli production assembly/transport component CsgF n=1 Tax=Pseudaminobacter soli (ex Zhang et al. 2022) TaxID=2831468 RepID=A0A942EAJ4_9HYPH|nr:curli assembly protein CsgF [Pseudaminobacter soli]MBS3651492.1 curli assembly protein CsgG [Pseudaminobacter soli]
MKVSTLVKGLAIAAVLAGSLSPSLADDVVYSPINPSFGGNALNSSHLLGLANAQRTATARDRNKGGGGGSDPGTGGGENTDVDLFIRQLQGRLLSALASQVTEAIFGENPQDNGTIVFGDTTVSFERTADSIILTITDPTGTTRIEVPQLVTTTNAQTLMQPMAQQTGSLGGSSLGASRLDAGGGLTVNLGSGLN